jgi:hypothetical protein
MVVQIVNYYEENMFKLNVLSTFYIVKKVVLKLKFIAEQIGPVNIVWASLKMQLFAVTPVWFSANDIHKEVRLLVDRVKIDWR